MFGSGAKEFGMVGIDEMASDAVEFSNAIAAAVAAERERCAKIAEYEFGTARRKYADWQYWHQYADKIAAAIRASQ